MRARVVAASGLTVLVTALAALATSAAHAAPLWSEPRSIGAPTGVVSGAEIGFGPGGTALLSRRTSAGIGEPRDDDASRLATLTPDGKLVEHRPLSDRLAAPPQLFGRGRVALLRERLLSEPDATPRRVRLSLSLGSTGRPAGRGRPRRLATFATFSSGGGPAMAVGPQGQIAIVWVAYRGNESGSGRFRVQLALRRPNGRFDRTRTVASGPAEIDGGSLPPVAVAVGARRDVVVAYAAGAIRVRSLRRGRRFAAPQTLGPSSGFVDLAARGARTGRVGVAWATQDGGEDVSEPFVVRAALRAPGAARFGATQVIDPGEANGERVAGRMRLALGADGTAALAWSNARGRFPNVTQPVRATVAEQDGGFGPVVELAASGAARDVAVRDDGAALVTWTDARGRTIAPVTPQTFAALRAGPAQPFGAPELIA